MDTARSVKASFLAGSTLPPVGDFDRDGKPDLLWRHQTLGSLYSWFMVGGRMTSGAYLQPERAESGSLQIQGLGDFNRDTHTDLLWQDRQTGTLVVWLMRGTTRLSTVAIAPIALPTTTVLPPRLGPEAGWQVRGVADINRDGHDDVVWHHPQTGALYAWYMEGTTATAGAAFSPARFADTRWELRALADFNGDGRVDLLWHNRTTGDMYAWFMNGTVATGGSYTTPSHFADTQWRLARLMDFNNDGKPDLLWQHQTTGDLYVWHMNGLTAVSGRYLDPIKPSDPAWQVVPR
jgi:hypothetical protein